jgi:hypothetical protein
MRGGSVSFQSEMVSVVIPPLMSCVLAGVKFFEVNRVARAFGVSGMRV